MRIITKDPKIVVEEGWCVTSPTVPPEHCSWCGVSFVIVNDIRCCNICDKPRPSGQLRPIDLDAADE